LAGLKALDSKKARAKEGVSSKLFRAVRKEYLFAHFN
jgi:hypothetical protein